MSIEDEAVAPQFTIEGKNIDSISSFYQEINRVFMQNEDWKLGESLDALNDLLYGGFGLLNGLPKIQLMWNDIEICRKVLGYEATRNYYLEKLQPGSPYNKVYHQQRLTELENGEGQTYFDIILEIISEHPNIRLIEK